MSSYLEQLKRNLEAYEKEKQRLLDNRFDDSDEEVRGLDVYTVSSKVNNSPRIQELNAMIAAIKSEINQEVNRLGAEARIARSQETKNEKNDSSMSGQYSYEVADDSSKTSNRALAARYDAQQRFFAASKMKQALYKLNGQYAKFEELWHKVDSKDKEKVANELDQLFGGAHGR